MRARLLKLVPPVLGLGLLSVALWALHRELRGHPYRELQAGLRAIPPLRLVLSSLCAAGSYLVLTGFDVLGLRYAGQRLPYRKVMAVSFIASALSNNIGFSVLSGGSLRYRQYSAEGLSALDTARVVGFVTTSFWVGFLTVAGAVLSVWAPALPPSVSLPLASLRPLGLLCLGGCAAYAALVFVRRRPLRLRGFELAPPSPGVWAAQVGLACLDWVLASSCLYLALPPGVGYLTFLGAYLIALIAGLVSQVPGGLGVFESVLVLWFSAQVPASALVGALLAYRTLYYLTPLAVAVLLLGATEALRHRRQLTWVAQLTARWGPAVVPQVVAFAVFAAGLVLLVSGATPNLGHRTAALRAWLPLPVTETSHLMGSIAGAGLLLVARGLQRRLDAARVLAMVLLVSGALLSVLKGLDYEEALLLAGLALALVPFRSYFHRRGALLHEPFTAGWIAAVALALIAVTWLGFFAYKHVEYSNDLFWRFAFEADAPRFLRASVAVTAAVLLFATARLLSPAPAEPPLPDPGALTRAREVVRRSRSTHAHLALLGDKHLLFNEAETALVMYGQEGRTFVSMGDPIGEPAERRELAWRLRELADRHAGFTAFYEVPPESLPLYVELGLSLQKLGEEAVVWLPEFTLVGNSMKGLRSTCHRLGKEGYRVEVLPAEAVRPLLPELRALSDAWLAEKKTREKGFSLGFFDERYLCTCPLAVVRRGHALEGFANLWLGAEKAELSVDLMRYRPGASRGVMDYLFCQLMEWGRAQGYARFNLGMAPFSGIEQHQLAPMFARLAGLLYRYGEYFYNFQGLRAYKEKFQPRWEPRYLASRGGWALPVVLANIAALVSRGLKGVVGR